MLDSDSLAEYIENPDVFEENREPTHVTSTVPYESIEAAREADERFAPLEDRFDRSPYFELLNGEWDFQFYERPADVPDDLDEATWESIEVPRNWQTEGYDQTFYVNTDITWNHYDPPLEGTLDPREGIDVPETNPTGIYRRSIEIPDDWDGREVFLHFEGVKQVFFVWIDDEYVGYQQGSMTPGEFDVTEHVEAGAEHEVVVQVHRFADSEALETIDMFRYSGIFRSVYLFSTPPVHVRDFFAKTSLDDEYEDGSLEIEADLENYGSAPAGEHELRARLFDPAGEAVASIADVAEVEKEGAELTLSVDLVEPAKWSAETPHLYELGLELLGPDGEVREALSEKIGFCEYETTRGQRGAQVLVNGEPTNIRGTNRHEADPDTARAIPVERIREDLEILKRFNFNAIRTSHYPNDPSLYRLADEYGIYVQDEVGVETHWWEDLAAETEAFHDQYVEYFRRMVLRDRNHPSIFSWSTGNEAGTGAEHLNMAALVKDTEEHLPREVNGERYEGSVEGLDPTRLLYHQPNGGGWTIEYNDMLGPRYPSVEALLNEGDGTGLGDGRRPVVMGEYNHAMGNSLGLIEEMWGEHIQPAVRRARDRSDAGADGVLVGSPDVIPGSIEPTGAVELATSDRIEVPDPDDHDVDPSALTVAVDVRELDPAEGSLLSADAFELSVDDGDLVFTVGGEAVRAPIPDDGGAGVIAGVSDDGSLRLVWGDEVLASSDRTTDETGTVEAPVTIGEDADLTVEGVGVFADSLPASAIADALRGGEGRDARLRYDFADLLRDQSLMGGFLWDWVNQDLNATTEIDGQQVAYQFYDDDPFCLDGLVQSDRTAKPGMWQVKYDHQPVGVAAADVANGEVYVTNHHGFTDLADYEVSWTLRADDETIDGGDLDLAIPPGETRRVAIPIEEPEDLLPGAEYWLSVSFRLAEDAPHADAGHEVAAEQLPVPFDVPDPEPIGADDLPAVSVSEDDETIIAGPDFEYAFDPEVGTFTSMQYGGSELIEFGPRINAWRPPIMNEVQAWEGEMASGWYEAGLDDLTHQVENTTVESSETSATVEVESFLEGADMGLLRRTPDATGGYATLQGNPEIVEGVSGDGVELNGESFLTLEGEEASLEDGLTLECWIRPGESAENNPRAQPYLVAGGQYLLKRRSPGRGGDLEFAVYSDGWHVVHAPVPEDWGERWHHVAGVWDTEGGELRLYVDGEPLVVDDFGGQVGAFDGRIRVGRDGSDFVSHGTRVDEVRLYRRDLTEDELASVEVPPGDPYTRLALDEFEEVDQDAPGFEATYRYRVYGDGSLAVDVDVEPNAQLRDVVGDYIPKLGLRTELLESFEAFEWYGRGPHETYPDRKAGIPVGRYAGSVEGEYFPYLPPTDNGNKTDTRWAALSDGDVGLLGRETDGLTNVNLEQWANLDEADHQHELEARGSVGFDVDHAVSGVGGTPRDPIERFQVKPEPLAFEVLFRPFDAGEDPMELAKREISDEK